MRERTRRRAGRAVLAAAMLAAAALGSSPAARGDVLVTDAQGFGPGQTGGVIRVDAATGAQAAVASGPPFVDPAGIALRADGVAVVADPRAHAVFRVAPGGQVGTLTAGAPLADPTGVAVAAGGQVYVADRGHSHDHGLLIRIDPGTGVAVVVAAGPPLVEPNDVAVTASGAVLVSDRRALGGAVLRVDPSGAVTPVAAGFPLEAPQGLAAAPGGAVFVADGGGLGRARIVRVEPATGARSVVASGPPLKHPRGLAVAADGALLVADRGVAGGGVVRVDPATGAATVIAAAGHFKSPSGIAGPPPGAGAPGAAAGAPGAAAGAPGAGGSSSAAGSQADRSAPELSAVRLARRSFGARRRPGPSVAAVTDTTVRYRLSERARVRFVVQRVHWTRRTCLHVRIARHRRCIRYLKRSGVFAHNGVAGENAFRFTGRVWGRPLRPGLYRLIARATDAAGNRSPRRVTRFRIVR